MNSKIPGNNFRPARKAMMKEEKRSVRLHLLISERSPIGYFNS